MAAVGSVKVETRTGNGLGLALTFPPGTRWEVEENGSLRVFDAEGGELAHISNDNWLWVTVVGSEHVEPLPKSIDDELPVLAGDLTPGGQEIS